VKRGAVLPFDLHVSRSLDVMFSAHRIHATTIIQQHSNNSLSTLSWISSNRVFVQTRSTAELALIISPQPDLSLSCYITCDWLAIAQARDRHHAGCEYAICFERRAAFARCFEIFNVILIEMKERTLIRVPVQTNREACHPPARHVRIPSECEAIPSARLIIGPKVTTRQKLRGFL
jgi:hypothetical protein